MCTSKVFHFSFKLCYKVTGAFAEKVPGYIHTRLAEKSLTMLQWFSNALIQCLEFRRASIMHL